MKQSTLDISSLTQKIIDYEQGEMDDEQALAFFAELVSNGLAWQLQGHYGRMARDLIEAGLIEIPPANTEAGQTARDLVRRGLIRLPQPESRN